MSGRTREPNRSAQPEAPGLLDEGPYLHLDQELLGNQELIERTRAGGVLGFDNPDPSFSRRPLGGVGNAEILERIAARGTPDPLLQPGPGPARERRGPSWLTPAGVGGSTGGWSVGFKPTLSTSDDLDDVGKRDRARRQQQDEMAERRDPRSKPE